MNGFFLRLLVRGIYKYTYIYIYIYLCVYNIFYHLHVYVSTYTCTSYIYIYSYVCLYIYICTYYLCIKFIHMYASAYRVPCKKYIYNDNIRTCANAYMSRSETIETRHNTTKRYIERIQTRCAHQKSRELYKLFIYIYI